MAKTSLPQAGGAVTRRSAWNADCCHTTTREVRATARAGPQKCARGYGAAPRAPPSPRLPPLLLRTADSLGCPLVAGPGRRSEPRSSKGWLGQMALCSTYQIQRTEGRGRIEQNRSRGRSEKKTKKSRLSIGIHSSTPLRRDVARHTPSSNNASGASAFLLPFFGHRDPDPFRIPRDIFRGSSAALLPRQLSVHTDTDR